MLQPLISLQDARFKLHSISFPGGVKVQLRDKVSRLHVDGVVRSHMEGLQVAKKFAEWKSQALKIRGELYGNESSRKRSIAPNRNQVGALNR